jgi:hypothetical protein
VAPRSAVEMRQAGYSHPGWGYRASARDFFRAARIVVAALAVGATASAGVVLALVDRPVEQTRSVPGTLVQPIQAASTSGSAPHAAQLSPQAALQSQPTKVFSASGQAGSVAQNEWPADLRTSVSVAKVDTVTNEANKAAVAPPLEERPAADLPVQAKPNKKHRVARHYAFWNRRFGLQLGEHRHAWGFSGG